MERAQTVIYSYLSIGIFLLLFFAMYLNLVGSPCPTDFVLVQELRLGFWATMKKYTIIANLIQVIKHLDEKVTGAVLFNNSIGDWFRTTVGVRQGCLLSPTLF